MAFKKYIRVNGKRYGPYFYENRREGKRVVTSYLGKESKVCLGLNKEKGKNILRYALFIFAVTLFVLFFISQLGLRVNITGSAIGESNVSACIELNQDDYVYRLTGDVVANGTCFIISANNITLVGNGYVVYYSVNGTRGYGVEIKGANNTLIDGLTVSEGSCFDDGRHGIVVNHSENFTLRNSSVYTCSISSSALVFASTGYGFIQNVNATTSNASSYGIHALSGENNIVARDVFVNAKLENDTYFGENTLGDVLFYNVSLAGKRTGFEPSSIINLDAYWYLDVYVNYSNITLADGARVIARNVTGASVFSVLTNESGNIERQNMLEYRRNYSDVTYASDYNISVTKTGFVSDTRSANMTSNRKIGFALTAASLAQGVQSGDNSKKKTKTTRTGFDDNITLNVDSESDDCVVVWECEEWGKCIMNKRERRCSIINNCDDGADKPTEEVDCGMSNVFFLDYYPDNNLNVAHGDTVNFVMNVITNISLVGENAEIEIKWYLNGELGKEEKSRDYLNSIFIHSFYFNRSKNVIEAEITSKGEKAFVIWDVNVLNITCEELWHCDWQECDEENMTYAYNCIDLNQCGTNLEKPVKERCSCVIKWECEEWGACETFYGADYIFDDGKVTSEYVMKKERNCVDMNHCEDKRTEYMTCGEKKSILLREVEWCGDSYMEVHDLNSNSLIGRLKTTLKEDVTRVDLGIVFDGERGYCSNCFNNMKDVGENDVDCGGGCKACKQTTDYAVDTGQIAWSILFFITFLLSMIGIYIGMKLYSVIVSLRKHKKIKS